MMPHTRHDGTLVIALAIALATAACTDGSGAPLAPKAAAPSADDAIIDLNPQPEPPSLELTYSLTPDGADWFGTIYVGGQACGSMQLLQSQPKETGIVTHVWYDLSITGANPAFQLDAAVDGIVEQGQYVFNGFISDGFYTGQTIHPQGEITTIGGGTTDQLTTLTGTVQLNPQPEPPSSDYPPSPCTG